MYHNYLIPASNFLSTVEMNGLVYDVEASCDLYENDVKPELISTKGGMQMLLDKPLFNPMSTVHLASLYYDEWGVQHAMQDRPKMERSVDDTARKEIMSGAFHSKADTKLILEVTQLLTRYKRLQKQASTYIVGLIDKAIQDDQHRIYTNLNLHTTVTGRLSSTEPNLQNITREKDDLPSIRKLFIAPEGCKIVQADYSQAELRVIAQLSGDEQLGRIYYEALDLHSEVAVMFYGENYVSEQRSKCKNMNFGVVYGQSAHTFKEKHGIPEAEGDKFIKWWWSRFSGVTQWVRATEQSVHNDGYILSPFGMKRRFHLLTKENIAATYREAVNFSPQNIASWLTLTAAMRVQERIDTKKARIALLVHDSILAEVDDDYVEEYSGVCKEVMEDNAKVQLDWDMPFLADMGSGQSWGDAK